MVDEGEDIDEYLDWSSARRPGLESQRINVDLPRHFLEKIDREAHLRGITRQSLIKAWLYDRLKRELLPAPKRHNTKRKIKHA